MTEFSTKNDNNQKSHFSQPLQNSPAHQNQQFHYSFNKHPNLKIISPSQQQHPHNINKKNSYINTAKALANIDCKINSIITSKSPSTSVQDSPLHYKKPLNSPNNSPFTNAYTRATKLSSQQQIIYQQQLLQQLRGNNKQTLYEQRLNDILAQQHYLQQQQQQLLHSTSHDSECDTERENELSEESLKQNVAIVLNNLDRYNNALHSIILNEQVTTSSYLDNIEEKSFYNNINNNNNNNITHNNKFLQTREGFEMATAATPESDYNSNATTPGGRFERQQHSHMVGFKTATATTGCSGNGVGNSNNALINGAIGVGNLNCSLASDHDYTHDNSG